jgi:hypothetical protein
MQKLFVTIVIAVIIPCLAAEPSSAQSGSAPGKALYSSRPKNYQRPTLAPMLPPTPVTQPMTLPAAPVETVIETPTIATPTESGDIIPGSLSGIDITPPAKIVVTEPKEEEKVEIKVLENLPALDFAAQKPVASVVSPLEPNEHISVTKIQNANKFSARLAKIQLEKHHLEKTLEHINKIGDDITKVETLVELAEYVSRDAKYKKEFDILYELAEKATDALAADEKIVVTMPTTVKPSVLDRGVVPVEPKKTVTLIEEEPLAVKPRGADAGTEESEPKIELDVSHGSIIEKSVTETIVEPKLVPVAETKTEEPKVEAPKKRPSILLMEEDEPEKVINKEETTVKPAILDRGSDEVKKTPQKRAMPGRRTVTLEEN